MSILRRDQRGDTIIEVLISVAIVSVALTGAYAATTHNTRNTQDTLEHAQALKLVEGQIEQLRATGSAINGHDCFGGNGVPLDSDPPGPYPCNVTADGTAAENGEQPAFTLKITPDTSIPPKYTVKATWDSLGGKTGNVTMYYRP